MRAGELEVLETPGDLAHRVGRDLAVLGGQVRRELVAVRLDEVADPEHDLGPLRQRRRPPGREGRPGLGHGRPDLGRGGEIDVAGQPAGRGIVDRALPTRCAGDGPSADPVADAFGGRGVGMADAGRGDLCHRGPLRSRDRRSDGRRTLRTAPQRYSALAQNRGRVSGSAQAMSWRSSARSGRQLLRGEPMRPGDGAAERHGRGDEGPAIQAANDRGIAPGRGHDRTAHGHSPERAEEQAAVAPLEPHRRRGPP